MTTNKLINEKSPYLLQHAHNPVNWYPWGEDAFDKAQSENKPIFLSIGYSTCHWCHVMAHESFEDDDVATILNDHYISIKVDREERPDIDAVYMKVCQMMTGHGGWPLTIFMTADKIPFYAGTYFPKESKHGLPGLIEVLTELHKKYTSDPDHISDVTENVTEALEQIVQTKSKNRLNKKAIQETFQQLGNTFDSEFGGFGSAPKFAQPQNAFFLLTYYQFYENPLALAMVEKTLKQMAHGGIFDQVGFGFARYSTDEAWLVPHFEKMLYDNAFLLMVYTECYQVTNDPLYKTISENIVEFISREMTSKKGGFYSAIDADSEGVEGKYYVWDYDEIYEILGEDVGNLYTAVYDITPEGNFEGKNIPNKIEGFFDETAQNHHITTDELHLKLDEARKSLLEAREKRNYPHVDDKILTSWNAMMITALAKAGKTFQNGVFVERAIQASQFIEENLFVDDRLMARYRDGETKFNAYLDDYVYLIWAYIELYESTYDLNYLQKAKLLMDDMIKLFWDETNGGFYYTGSDSEKLIMRDKEIFDSDSPSGNSIAAFVLIKLSSLTGEMTYLEKCEEMYYAFHDNLSRYAAASPFFMRNLIYTEHPRQEVVIIGAETDSNRKKLLKKLQETPLHATSVLVGEHPDDFIDIAPFATQYKQIDNKTTVYICENFACDKPTTNLEEAFQKIVG